MKLTITVKLANSEVDFDVYYVERKAEFSDPAYIEITDLHAKGKNVSNLLEFEDFTNFLLSEIKDELSDKE